jgi:REP element-mobilizing transposase RayT
MRRARVTFLGAFHHGMNRGYEGRNIFEFDSDKEYFLGLMEECTRIYKIRILAFAIMSNHYHLVLENSTGKMSEFFKKLNGQFARNYRKRHGGKGYIFQDRYKSLLIQEDSYLLLAISYVLYNPVKAKLCDNFLDYKWSSSGLYFSGKTSKIVDTGFVEELFHSRNNLINIIPSVYCDELPIIKTREGWIVGGNEFVIEATKKFDRRKGKESLESKRINDKYFEPVEKVFWEFEKKHKIKLSDIDNGTHQGKRLRAKLLVNLKERSGLKYNEIIKFDLFVDLKISSLGRIYKNAKYINNQKK